MAKELFTVRGIMIEYISFVLLFFTVIFFIGWQIHACCHKIFQASAGKKPQNEKLSSWIAHGIGKFFYHLLFYIGWIVLLFIIDFVVVMSLNVLYHPI